MAPGTTVSADRRVYSVTELTRSVRFLLETNFSGVWLEGEVCNFKEHSSGHLYFSLKDEECQMACVMFRREASALPFRLGEGQCVIAYGRVSVYPQRGQYQFYVERAEPKGLGALQLRFQQLKDKLAKEGLFDESRKRPLPFLPHTIAVVTSTDGAALRDILHVLDRRFSDAHILIAPVQVQGSVAAAQVAAAIEELNRLEAADVILVARGGGSLEDLWAFNEEITARAIAGSRIPVISAIGHETDFTIADFVADYRAPTPSAAAEIVMPPKAELVFRVGELKARALAAVGAKLESARRELKALEQSQGLKNPLLFFRVKFQRLDELKKSLDGCVRQAVRERREKLSGLLGQLEALGPASALRRGFSATFKGGRIVRSVKNLKSGDEVTTRLSDGSFTARVEKVEANKEGRT